MISLLSNLRLFIKAPYNIRKTRKRKLCVRGFGYDCVFVSCQDLEQYQMLELKKEQEVMQVLFLSNKPLLGPQGGMCSSQNLLIPRSLIFSSIFSSSFSSFFTHYYFHISSELFPRPHSFQVRLENIKLKNRLKKREMQLKAKVSAERLKPRAKRKPASISRARG